MALVLGGDQGAEQVAGWVGAPAFRAPAFDAGLLGLFIPVVLVLVADICGYPRHQVTRDASLHGQLGYDSIMVVQLKERIKARWGIPVDLQKLLIEVSTPGQLIDHLRTRIVVADREGHHG